MELIETWFREFYQFSGINLTIVYDGFDRDRFLRGLGNTVLLSIACLILSVLIGILGAWFLGSKRGWVRRIVQGYVQVFRNTPPLAQLYFFFFALGALLTITVEQQIGQATFERTVPIMSNFQWAIISLSLFAGAFNVEIFRSGIEAVPSTTLEAAEALGMSRWQIYR